MREPRFALQLAAGLPYLAFGGHLEAVPLSAIATLSVVIAIAQAMRTERTLDAIRHLSSPCALVIRDGTRHRIPGQDVVRGDLLVVTEGDRVPADAVLLSATGLETDEFLLIGESVPVRKTAEPGDTVGSDAPAAEARFFSGTLVVSGEGLAQVAATGATRPSGGSARLWATSSVRRRGWVR